MMWFYTVLIYVIIAAVGNAAFYFACQGEYDSCAKISAIFFNVAVACQLLPLITNRKTHEKNQNKGQRLICIFYLLTVIIWGACCLGWKVSYVTSGIVQIILFGIFLVMFFSVARATVKTNRILSADKVNRSSSLLEAKANLRYALASCRNVQQRAVLREVSTELESMAVKGNMNFESIDNEILAKVRSLCCAPDDNNKTEVSKLIQKRKSMTMLISQ